MPRNGSGTFSLPAANPVTTGTQITATWGNTTLSDIASEITGSVAADGQTTITGPIKFSAGSVSSPAMTFSSETNTGFYRSGAGVVSMSIAGSQKYIFGASSVTLGGSASITGTEFGYLTGVTSAIQTQLDAKQPLDSTLTALAGTLTAANKIPYATALNTAGELDLSTSTSLGTSDTTLSSQKAVKSYVDTAVAAVNTSSLGASGYVILSGGLIVQWGKIASATYAASSSTAITINLPHTFPTAGVAFSLQVGTGITNSPITLTGAVSTTQITGYFSNGGGAGATCEVSWIAVGY